MRIYDIIKKKRDGGELSPEEIEFFVKGYTDGSIPDYQAAALCMAIFFKGLNERETSDLTVSMANSGDIADLSELGEFTADKHSTGGVGDKTTLIIAPIVASLGCIMAKMSGRGLGHTGGTVDKLESVKGYRTSLTRDEFMNQAKKVGVAVVDKMGNLTPADKKIYALRDVTATVDSIPLIASSVMSKKLAAGAKTIVLDVKCGSGAFMKTPGQAKILAEEMVKIAKSNGRKAAAVITDMDSPLGCGIGNAIEVCEAIEVLKGNGPDDLREVSLALSAEIISLSKDIPVEEARKKAEDVLDSGKAYEKFKEWISAQGGTSDFEEAFPKAKFSYEVKAARDGYISRTDAEKVGVASMILGAGRETKDDVIDMSAGIVLKKKTGDKLKKGDIIATLYSDTESSLKPAAERFLSALEFSDTKPQPKPLIYEVIK